MRRQVKQQKVFAQMEQAVNEATRTVTSAEDFMQWFRDHWNLLALHGYYRTWGFDQPEPQTQLVNVSWTPRRGWWNNSHSCPRGGVINWSREPGNPTSYLGWRGNMTWQYTGHDSYDFCGCDMFAGTVIHTGTGGGDHIVQYDVLLWADDWPAWKLAEEHLALYNILKYT